MAPNDAQIVSVFVRETAGGNAADSIPVLTPWEIVAEVEAGNAIFGAGAHYEVGGVLKDLTSGSNTPLTPAAGAFGAGPWATKSAKIQFAEAPIAMLNSGHLFEVLVYAKVNAAAPYDMSFVRSNTFIAA